MAPAPQKFREIVFQLLYCKDFEASQDEDISDFLIKEYALSNTTIRLAKERRDHIAIQRQKIDERIAKASLSYALDRIPQVELNVLRLGVFELLYDEKIPAQVAIAESIRLARKFASPEAGSFVNAVLDTLYKESKESHEECCVAVSEGQASL